MNFKISPILSETFIKPVVQKNVAAIVVAAAFSVFLVTLPLTAPIIYFSFKRVREEYREAKQRLTATQTAAESASKALKERKVQALTKEFDSYPPADKSLPPKRLVNGPFFQKKQDTDVKPDYTNFVIPKGVHQEKFLQALDMAATMLNIVQTKEGQIIQFNTREALTEKQQHLWHQLAQSYYTFYLTQPSFNQS